jgi:hypothetical protein
VVLAEASEHFFRAPEDQGDLGADFEHMLNKIDPRNKDEVLQ